MIRRFVLLLVLLLFSLPLSAQDDSLSVVWMLPPSDEVLTPLVEEFFTDFTDETGIEVTLNAVDWAMGKETILEMVEAGNPPDIALVGVRWVPEFVAAGLIEPLDSYLTREFRSRFESALLAGTLYQGQTFGLPVATSTRALYYNRDLFEQADIDSAPQTWDDLLQAGVAVGELGEDIHGFGLQGGGGVETNTYFYYFLWGNNGDLYNPTVTASALDQPQSVQALSFIKRMIDEGATQPNPTDEAYERRRSLEDMFRSGNLGMVISGPWFAARLRNEAPEINFGLAPLPYNASPATYGVIDTLIMLRTSDSKEQAWQLLEFLYSDARRLAYTQAAGVLPALKVVADDPDFAQDEDFAVFLSLLPEARFETLHIESSAITQIVIDAIQQVYRGEQDAEAALSAAALEINDLLETTGAGW